MHFKEINMESNSTFLNLDFNENIFRNSINMFCICI